MSLAGEELLYFLLRLKHFRYLEGEYIYEHIDTLAQTNPLPTRRCRHSRFIYGDRLQANRAQSWSIAHDFMAIWVGNY
jgi:hypothetical protein